jgi:N-acetylneuraminic acid mutarotase
LVYDDKSGKVILFGGWAGTDFNDTWAYDPVANSWTDLAPTGDVPPARHDHVMTIDTDTGLVILFGGTDAKTYEEFADTWAYDPASNTWTDLAPTGDVPPSRCLHAMVYDPATKKVILFGGSRHGGCLGDVWAYDPAANVWTELAPTGTLPLARYGGTMVYDPGLGRCLLFGGSDGHLMGDTWAFDPATATWTLLMAVDSPAARPAAREFYSMAYDPGAQRTVLFGGCGVDPLGDTWSYDSATNTWTDLAPSGETPSPRTYSPLVFVASTGVFVMFGGSEAVAASSPVGDTWSYDPTP